MVNKIRISYGIYSTANYLTGRYEPRFILRRMDKDLNIPSQFKKLIRERLSKWNKKDMDFNEVEFTYGVNEDKEIHAISIVHPLDNFSRKTGRGIVKNRIRCTERFLLKNPEGRPRTPMIWVE